MNLNKLIPSLLPVFAGYHYYYGSVRRQNLSSSLTACLSKVGYRAILTSLVSYKSPDNVPDTFTPDVMQTVLRFPLHCPFFGRFAGTTVIARFRHQ